MSDVPNTAFRIAVGIATADRPHVLAGMLRTLSLQTRSPDAVVICSPSDGDTAVSRSDERVRWIPGERGLTKQRNAIIRAVLDFDLVVFFDDDFIACRHYLESVESVFRNFPEIVIATGHIVKDGILGPGLDVAQGLTILEQDNARDHPRELNDVYNAYGCNMAIRLATVRANGLRFDENLPLYGWLEDVDFSRRAAPHGRIVRIGAARGVHLGVKRGRQPGKKLGYSQISNPVYLVRKGSHTWPRALKLMSRNVLANAIRTFYPEPYTDRLGRSIGNCLALVDLCFGRASPGRILQI
jgi:GT2 family glycosyltransferase